MVISDVNSELMDILLDFGESMMDSGAEIARVEDSLSRMGHAYGASATNVFVITSSIELTISFPNGETVTRTRRIRSSGNTDFYKLSRLNAISRKCAMKPMEISSLLNALEEIRDEKIPIINSYVGSFLASGGFSVFFGGTLLDGLFSGLFGLFVCWFQQNFSALSPNKVFFLYVCSVLMGTGTYLVNMAMPFVHIDKVIIGDIMLVVPGISITTAVRDTLIGDTISGVTRLADCLVWAAALAAGIMTVLSFLAR